jgi:ASC-1-like (ASCH) protein
MRSHLAILKSKYLDLIISGEKTLECRLSRIACAPYRQAAKGEKVFLKQSAGPIKAQALIKKAVFFKDLTPEDIKEFSRLYNDEVRAEADFWKSRRHCRYASLIWLTKIEVIAPYCIKRKGLQGWVVSKNNAFDLQQ